MNSRHLIRLGAGAVVVLAVACKDSNGPERLGPPASLTLSNTTIPTAPANTQFTPAVSIVVKDAAGHLLPDIPITFAVTAGGGSLVKLTDTTDASGQVPVPAWTLGKSKEPQTVTASAGSGASAVTVVVNASVQSAYNIEVRFFGTPMTSAQQQLFTKAAQRIMAIVTGDVIDADARQQSFDLASQCGISGQPPFSELVDDVIIYASIRDIDGPGKILAQAGPCLIRDAGTTGNPMPMPAVGDMSFDAADINTITGAGSFQEVITHEMLHVLGFGVFWDDRSIIVGAGTSDPRYTGAQGVQGCRDVGGTVSCALSVPVENSGGAGTADSHWREATFNTELMTGFVDQSPNPLSKMTIGSLADLGYVVNNADFDPYTIAIGSMRAAIGATSLVAADHPQWESLSHTTIYELQRDGRITARRLK